MTRSALKARPAEPLYQQIKSHVTAAIEAGRWPPGSRVPSENELVSRFGISRMTANRALRELMHAGYLKRMPGIGTFVREAPRQASLLELRNIAEEIAARGHRHASRVVALKEVRADRPLAAAFAARPGATLYFLSLVHMEDGTPVQLEERHVNPAIVPRFLEQDFTAVTPTAYLLSVSAVDELEHSVKAVLPSPATRRLLKMAPHRPCLALHRRSWNRGIVVTDATLTYPADRYELRSRYRTTPGGRLIAPSSLNENGNLP
jgi:GntR family histidine utilization transcriptional repressor